MVKEVSSLCIVLQVINSLFSKNLSLTITKRIECIHNKFNYANYEKKMKCKLQKFSSCWIAKVQTPFTTCEKEPGLKQQPNTQLVQDIPRPQVSKELLSGEPND